MFQYSFHKQYLKRQVKLPAYTTATRFLLVARATNISKAQNNHQVKKRVL